MSDETPRGKLAAAIQEWQDKQWQVPLNTLPPTNEAYSLADHLIGCDYANAKEA